MGKFSILFRFFVVAIVVIAGNNSPGAQPQEQAAPARKGMALTVGLNGVNPKQYAGWNGRLLAAENDANDLAAIAKSRGFSTTVLLTGRATRKGVIDEIKRAAASMQPGDSFIFTYSGHGGQIRDQNGDETDDQMDETMCLYDGELIDDELAALWTLFPAGAKILVLADCCHSGTLTKCRAYAQFVRESPLEIAGADSFADRFQATFFTAGDAGKNDERAVEESLQLKTWELARGESPMRRILSQLLESASPVRLMHPLIAEAVLHEHREFYDALGKNTPSQKTSEKRIQATVLLISACQDNQLALDGQANGLFTGTLKSVWNNGQFAGTYPAFFQAIVRQMPPYQPPNYKVIGPSNPTFEAQTPFSP